MLDFVLLGIFPKCPIFNELKKSEMQLDTRVTGEEIVTMNELYIKVMKNIFQKKHLRV